MTRRALLSLFLPAALSGQQANCPPELPRRECRKRQREALKCPPKSHPFYCAWLALQAATLDFDDALEDVHTSLTQTARVKDLKRPEKWDTLIRAAYRQAEIAEDGRRLDTF
jgi:hypothetical protein